MRAIRPFKMWKSLLTSVLVIISQYETNAQCYAEAEIGSLENTRETLQTLDFVSLLASLQSSIEHEMQSNIEPLNDRFAVFENGHLCQISQAEIKSSQIESAITFNKTILTNLITFPKLTNCYIEEDFPELLDEANCKEWLQAISEELDLENLLPVLSKDFLKVFIQNGQIKGLGKERIDPLICNFNPRAKSIKMRKETLENQMKIILSIIFETFKIIGNQEVETQLLSCMDTEWTVTNLRFDREFSDCLKTITKSNRKRSTLFSRIFSDGAELDHLSEKIHTNTRIVNGDLLAIGQNEAMLKTQTQALNKDLRGLNMNLKKLHLNWIAQTLNNEMQKLSQENFILYEQNFERFSEVLKEVSEKLSNIQTIIGSLIMKKEDFKCLIYEGMYSCINIQDSFVKALKFGVIRLHISFEVTKSHKLVFISCRPLSQQKQSSLHHQHAVVSNQTLLFSGGYKINMEQISNQSIVYAQTKPLERLLQNNILILFNNGMLGFYCIKTVEIHSATNSFNCSEKIHWQSIDKKTKLFTKDGLLLRSEFESLKIESRTNFNLEMKRISNLESSLFDQFTPLQTTKWHHLILNKLKQLSSTEAISFSIGSFAILVILCIFPVICLLCRKFGICCFRPADSVRLSVVHPTTVESVETRSRRLVDEFIDKLKSK